MEKETKALRMASEYLGFAIDSIGTARTEGGGLLLLKVREIEAKAVSLDAEIRAVITAAAETLAKGGAN